MGGGTDFPSYFKDHGGCVLTTAINKYVYVIIKERFDDHIRLGYSITENVLDVNDLKHELAREAIKRFPNIKGIEISTMADVPGGTGLGSSSAVTVGFVHALSAYRNELISKRQLSFDAIDIEVYRLNKPIGYQDQIISVFGGFKKITFGRGENYNVCDVDILEENKQILQNNLLLWYTTGVRDSETILTEQKENIDKNIPLLKEISKICKEAEESLRDGRIDDIGYLLNESWMVKKQLASKISNPNIDDLYEYAMKNGATGGKILGAGGGGFLMTYCPLKWQPLLRMKMKVAGIREFPFQFEKDGSKVIFDCR
jgi:D-glycero-alpha-D-manno-heptose-7-phosphate kinase